MSCEIGCLPFSSAGVENILVLTFFVKRIKWSYKMNTKWHRWQKWSKGGIYLLSYNKHELLKKKILGWAN